MRVFVTGATSFIASAMVQELLGAELLGWDPTQCSQLENLERGSYFERTD